MLYGINNSDSVQNAVARTGIQVTWAPFGEASGYSHGTRIRSLRHDIETAYAALEGDEKGLFAQIVVKAMLERYDAAELREKLLAVLGDIGWTVTEGGELQTKDALLSEQFFPPSSQYDAYIAIRDVLGCATKSLLIEDNYVGTSLLQTLRALGPRQLAIRILTVEKNLPPDFIAEAAVLRKQLTKLTIDLRTSTDFHDRFIIVDNADVYHVGASMKDAGKRAFMVSRVEDAAISSMIKRRLEEAWSDAAVV